MRPQVLLVALAVFAVLVALPLGKPHEEDAGVVDASRDTSTSGCHPECKACVKSISDGLYECKDRIANFCQRRCTRPAAADA